MGREATWRNLAARSSGRLAMKGMRRVESPVTARMADMKPSFMRLVVRSLVKMWLVRMLPRRKPEKPRVQTRVMVEVSVPRLYARYGCIGPAGRVPTFRIEK